MYKKNEKKLEKKNTCTSQQLSSRCTPPLAVRSTNELVVNGSIGLQSVHAASGAALRVPRDQSWPFQTVSTSSRQVICDIRPPKMDHYNATSNNPRRI